MADTKGASAKAAPKEAPAVKFTRLGTKRTQGVLKAVRLLGQLGSPSYEYTPEQVGRIFDAIDTAVKAARQRFEQPTRTTREDFSL